jgi:hypothetical protein
MKLETVMRKIQEADVDLADIVPEESYNFAIDINTSLKKMGHYSIMYYERCEEAGLTYKEATDKLGEYLRSNLTYVVKKNDKNEQS